MVVVSQGTFAYWFNQHLMDTTIGLPFCRNTNNLVIKSTITCACISPIVMRVRYILMHKDQVWYEWQANTVNQLRNVQYIR